MIIWNGADLVAAGISALLILIIGLFAGYCAITTKIAKWKRSWKNGKRT